MKSIFTIFFIVVISFTSVLYSQDKQDSKWGIALSGFVKSDIIFDSRQTVNAREGHFLFYPQNELLDIQGKDINAKSSLNILSIQTRLNGKITGPDALDAKTSAMIEGEFFGTSDNDVNGFRLRHAIINLDWEKTSLMVGQFWHPMFVTDVFPGTVSFNTGSPFQPFTRNPQIRLTQRFSKNLSLSGTAYSERDFQSYGPNGQSSSYLRNSVLPGLNLQLQYKSEKFILGASGDFKMLTPELSTSKNYVTDEKVKSFAAEGYLKFILDSVTFKFEGIWGQNLADMFMLGGYAAKTYDTLTGIKTYSPISLFSIWCDISSGKKIEVGIFGGYTKNLGSSDDLYKNISFYYSRGSNIDCIFRVSPRLLFNLGKMRIATELEYTTAMYGTTNLADKGKVENTKAISNLRCLLAFYYFF
jgi:hypothetical protein